MTPNVGVNPDHGGKACKAGQRRCYCDGAARPCKACRSGSGVERPVRPARTSAAHRAPPARLHEEEDCVCGALGARRAPTCGSAGQTFLAALLRRCRAVENRWWRARAVPQGAPWRAEVERDGASGAKGQVQEASRLRRAVLRSADQAAKRGLTFELTPTAEAGAVRPGGDDSTAGADRPYSACRSGSGVERVVRRRRTQPLLQEFFGDVSPVVC